MSRREPRLPEPGEEPKFKWWVENNKRRIVMMNNGELVIDIPNDHGPSDQIVVNGDNLRVIEP